MLKQLKSGFKRTINWNTYQSERSIERRNPYLDYLIDLSFQGVNRLYLDCVYIVLSFKDNPIRKAHTRYFLPTAKMI